MDNNELRPIIDQYLQQNKKEITDAMSVVGQTLKKMQITWGNQIYEAFTAIEALLTANKTTLVEACAKIQKRLTELPDEIKNCLITLAHHGWYLDEEMSIPDLNRLQRLLSNGNITAGEQILIEHFNDRAETIRGEIVQAFPNRADPINAAFQAHHDGKFYLSVPVFLIQADGIFEEGIGATWTSTKTEKGGAKVTKTLNYVDNLETTGAVAAALLEPLKHIVPINMSAAARPQNFSGLNRHLVLHGEDNNYGTKINSLKALSFINYAKFTVSA